MTNKTIPTVILDAAQCKNILLHNLEFLQDRTVHELSPQDRRNYFEATKYFEEHIEEFNDDDIVEIFTFKSFKINKLLDKKVFSIFLERKIICEDIPASWIRNSDINAQKKMEYLDIICRSDNSKAITSFYNISSNFVDNFIEHYSNKKISKTVAKTLCSLKFDYIFKVNFNEREIHEVIKDIIEKNENNIIALTQVLFTHKDISFISKKNLHLIYEEAAKKIIKDDNKDFLQQCLISLGIEFYETMSSKDSNFTSVLKEKFCTHENHPHHMEEYNRLQWAVLEKIKSSDFSDQHVHHILDQYLDLYLLPIRKSINYKIIETNILDESLRVPHANNIFILSPYMDKLSQEQKTTCIACCFWRIERSWSENNNYDNVQSIHDILIKADDNIYNSMKSMLIKNNSLSDYDRKYLEKIELTKKLNFLPSPANTNKHKL